MSQRLFVGLSVGSALEAADAVVVRAAGLGLGLVPRVEKAARVPFPLAASCRFRSGAIAPNDLPELLKAVADAAVQAVRSAVVQAKLSARDVFAVGFLEPARPAAETGIAWSEVADRVAEQTGFTVAYGFRGRDRAAGGRGHPIAAAAEFLLARDDREERLLVHLGAATGVALVLPGAKVSGVVAFEAGPGHQLLDALAFQGTRGREPTDPGGKKAVQGHCLEPLLTRWLEHPYLTRTPPKAVRPDTFGKAFTQAAFDTARQLGAGLPDLLCTATHLIARAVGEACRNGLPPAVAPRRVLCTGGGVRNGFLWQLLAQQFPGIEVERADAVGIPAAARNATAGAVLAALTCDGVSGNLHVLTGATGGRLLGRIIPGDGRNWARCATWLAEQTGDYPRVSHAA